MPVRVLGISAWYHDSAAALVVDGQIVAAAQEERFTRKKHDASFPRHAIASCLREGGVALRDVEHVVFSEKPLLKFERILETSMAFAPRGLGQFLTSMPLWIHEKLFQKQTIRRELAALDSAATPSLLFGEHHRSHAASAFFPSGFERAAVLCMDGVGEWATTSLWLGEGNSLTPQWQLDFPHSLGLLYSAFTYHAGFKVNSGEYKLMGLAPYGEPRYVEVILRELVDLKPDGTFHLAMKYFDFATGLKMTNTRFDALFGGPPRTPEGPLTQRELDLARSIQEVTERIVLALCRTAHAELGTDALCLAGGVALNCVANGRVQREGPFRRLFIQPAAGDAGGALGAAMSVWHEHLGQPRRASPGDGLQGSFLGPREDESQIRVVLEREGAVFERLEDDVLLPRVAARLAQGAAVGWVSGRMEFGPRALGARSILGDPRQPKMQSVLNQKIKHRESFRPFAPAVLAEKAADCFELEVPSPYMLLVAPIKEALRLPEGSGAVGLERLQQVRSTLPAVTHVDFSARVQTVHAQTNPRFHALLSRFDEQTGCPVLVNTSFNVRGEPIVCTTEDAWRCFMRTELDCLVIEQYFLEKARQPAQPSQSPRGAIDALD